jgi:hypothetical protein
MSDALIFGLTIPELIGNLLAFLFTLLVLMYAFGDNAFFRLAVHIFIGAAAGYTAAVAIRGVLWPQLQDALATNNLVSILAPMLLMALLFLKLSPSLARLGNPASGLLVGVGAAVAVGGALQGTLLPNLTGAFGTFSSGSGGIFGNFLNGTIILVGTVTSLAYFQFGAPSQVGQIAQRRVILRWLARIGHAFIAITLGVVFAGVYSAALSALTERFDYLIDMIFRVTQG